MPNIERPSDLQPSSRYNRKGISVTQNIFIDTEFTGFENPQLISIGLIARDGEEFYAEVEYDLGTCSDFVKKYVIPLLSQNEKWSLERLKVQLAKWIEVVREDGRVLLCYDSEYDRKMLESIFKGDFPNGVLFRNLGSNYVNKIKQYEYHVKTNQVEHHALHDARALKYAFRGWVRTVR